MRGKQTPTVCREDKYYNLYRVSIINYTAIITLMLKIM